MMILGHKNINNTLIYTQVANFKDDEYISKVAATVEEACKLVEAGFECVCKIGDANIFQKEVNPSKMGRRDKLAILKEAIETIKNIN